MDQVEKFFARTDLMCFSSEGSTVLIPFNVNPEEYIEYARSDFKENQNRGLINALSNAKRALHCQLDVILYVFGLFEKSRRKNWNFPTKLELINKLIPSAPKLLNKINRKRNLLEHDYIVPDKNEVEDFIDIVELFQQATNRYYQKIVKRIEICTKADLDDDSTNPGDEHCWINWDPLKKKFEVNYVPKKGKMEIYNGNPDDKNFLKFCEFYSRAIHLY